MLSSIFAPSSTQDWMLLSIALILGIPTGLAIGRGFKAQRERERGLEDEELGSLPRVLEESPDGVADFGFRLVEHARLPDGAWRLIARGWHEEQVIGFSATVRGDWKPANASDGLTFFTGGTVELASLGLESDRFVAALRRAYGVASPIGPMQKTICFTGISLQGNPSRLGDEHVRIKLFLESDDEDCYAECYFNVDVRGLRLQLHEKDEDYREPLIKALTSGS